MSPVTYLARHLSFEIVYDIFSSANDYLLVKIYDSEDLSLCDKPREAFIQNTTAMECIRGKSVRLCALKFFYGVMEYCVCIIV